ncbi:MAG: dynamin family protein, partial [Dermatophilaceae bacterium]
MTANTPEPAGEDTQTARTEPTGLAQILRQAHQVATDEEAERLHQLRDRLARQRLRVLVAGEAKRGKSTLINALLGRDLLPTGVLPLTAITTTVTLVADGEPEHATATLPSGATRH